MIRGRSSNRIDGSQRYADLRRDLAAVFFAAASWPASCRRAASPFPSDRPPSCLAGIFAALVSVAARPRSCAGVHQISKRTARRECRAFRFEPRALQSPCLVCADQRHACDFAAMPRWGPNQVRHRGIFQHRPKERPLPGETEAPQCSTTRRSIELFAGQCRCPATAKIARLTIVPVTSKKSQGGFRGHFFCSARISGTTRTLSRLEASCPRA